MANKTFTRAETEDELRKLNTTEATAYFRICKMNLKMIQSSEDRKQNEMHLEIMTAILHERSGKHVYYLLENHPESIWGQWHFADGMMGLSSLQGYERRVAGHESWKIAYSSIDGRKVEEYYFEQVKNENS